MGNRRGGGRTYGFLNRDGHALELRVAEGADRLVGIAARGVLDEPAPRRIISDPLVETPEGDRNAPDGRVVAVDVGESDSSSSASKVLEVLERGGSR